jgi:hypothetical protein
VKNAVIYAFNISLRLSTLTKEILGILRRFSYPSVPSLIEALLP